MFYDLHLELPALVVVLAGAAILGLLVQCGQYLLENISASNLGSEPAPHHRSCFGG